jgi:DNA-directed RNA polymerase specialized sigma24 family protein
MDLSEEHSDLAVRASGIGSDAGLARLLKWILDQFDATARRTLELHFQGRTPREIAYELGISKDAVYKRLRRALKRIHALLDDAPLT